LDVDKGAQGAHLPEQDVFIVNLLTEKGAMFYLFERKIFNRILKTKPLPQI
jgi:hypothetical protein